MSGAIKFWDLTAKPNADASSYANAIFQPLITFMFMFMFMLISKNSI